MGFGSEQTGVRVGYPRPDTLSIRVPYMGDLDVLFGSSGAGEVHVRVRVPPTISVDATSVIAQHEGMVPGDGEQLVRVIRQISQIQERMAAVEAELAELMNTDDYGMFAEAREQGFKDFLNNLSAVADTENNRLKASIEQVSRQIEEILGPSSG